MKNNSLKPLAITFFAKGIIDGGFVLLYLLFAMLGGLRMKDVFLPAGNSGMV